jgi:para-nitrobenzyl esterase
MIITTTQGQIEGIEREGIWQFRGIPYAAAPVGERRFMAPEPPLSWDGVRSGATFGATSWPEPGGVTAMLGDQGLGADEDCLHLNVFTPDCDDAARPVMVWIHGGSFVGGSGSTPWYDGTALATRGDVVVVTINYRLGALGFLWLGDLDDRYRSSGMNGILDQAAALAWVHENIAAFGGDPDNVTIFGESAGAMSVSTLLATPAARGLFHRAIAQSGAAEHVSSTTTAAGVTEAIMADLGVSTIDELLAVEPEALVAAGARVDGLIHTEPGRSAHRTGALAMIFQPVIDGEWLPEDPLVAVAQGRAADVPLLIGTNLDEWHLFRLMGSDVLDHEELLTRMARVFGDGVRAHESYSATRPGATPSDLWSAVLTDAIFRIPAIRLVEARENAASPTYQYLFSWPSSAFDGALGSCHALEIPFVFGVLGNPGAEMIFGGAASTELEELAAQMQHAWLAFARTGDPGHDGLPHWPVANSSDRPAMRFDLTSELLLDHDGDQRSLWDGIL